MTTKQKKKLSEIKVQSNGSEQPSHMIINALAGTGKTFTQIVGIAWAFASDTEHWDEVKEGIARTIGADPETFELQPSDEQQAIWNELRRSNPKSITYCAFNRSIVGEFSEKWGWLVSLFRERLEITLQFATINGLGHRVVGNQLGRKSPTNFRHRNLLEKITGLDARELNRRDATMVTAICELVKLAKLNLTGWTEEDGFDAKSITNEQLEELANHYDVELNGHRNRVFRHVRHILFNSFRDAAKDMEMSWDDQNWLPVVKDLPIPQVDLLLVDEGQDLNRCRQEYCRKAGRRVVLVGDVNQAIYGFAGADVESIPRMQGLLEVEGTFRLTETRRCGKAIVQEAQQIVPEFRAHESNPEGVVRNIQLRKFLGEVKDGDMGICRTNAPPISLALKLIKKGRKAIVRGRDFGGQLIRFVEKFEAKDVSELVEKVDAWYHLETERESNKKNPSEPRLMAIEDRRDCVSAFCEGVTEVSEVTERMQVVFAGKQCPNCNRAYDESVDRCSNNDCKTETDPISGYPCGPKLVTPKGVLFSSIHRAKGLESKRVFILTVKGASIPHPMAKTEWQRNQEMNLKYVAITRAINELVWVTD